MIKDVTAEELVKELDNQNKPREEILIKSKKPRFLWFLRVYIPIFIVTFITYCLAVYFQSKDVQNIAEIMIIFLSIIGVFLEHNQIL